MFNLFDKLRSFVGITEEELNPTVDFASFFSSKEEQEGFVAFVAKAYTQETLTLIQAFVDNGVPEANVSWMEEGLVIYRATIKSKAPVVEEVATQEPEVKAEVETKSVVVEEPKVEVEVSFEDKVQATLSSLPVHNELVEELKDLNDSIGNLQADLKTAEEGQAVMVRVNDALTQMGAQINVLIQTEESLINQVAIAKAELSDDLKAAHQTSVVMLNTLRSRRAKRAQQS